MLFFNSVFLFVKTNIFQRFFNQFNQCQTVLNPGQTQHFVGHDLGTKDYQYVPLGLISHLCTKATFIQDNQINP